MTITMDFTPTERVEHRLILHMALRVLHQLRQREREYAEEVKSYGDRGYRPKYCIHGTYLWVDWDPICGPCEDGDTYPREPNTLRLQALDVAHDRWARYKQRNRLALDALHLDAPPHITSALAEWAGEPIREILED